MKRCQPARIFLFALFSWLLGLESLCQPTIQATIKPGAAPSSVDIYTKSSQTFSSNDDQLTISLAVPADIIPAPNVGPGITGPLQTGPVSSVTGLVPNILYTNIGTQSLEVVVSMEMINSSAYYVYTFIFATMTGVSHQYFAGIEQKLLSVQFDNCTSGCGLLPKDILLVSLPDGGRNANAYFYYQVNDFLGDITNINNKFYKNPLSSKPNNGPDYTTLSSIGMAPDMEIDDVSQDEGNGDSTIFNFTVRLLNPAPAGGIGFNVSTSGGTATAGTDYMPINTMGFIPAGSTSTIVSVTVRGDTAIENNETFFVNITNVTNGNFNPQKGIGTILSDDGFPPPSLSISDVVQNEGNGFGNSFIFLVSLSSPAPAGGISLSVGTSNGTATAGSDYSPFSSNILIPAGRRSESIRIGIVGDLALENDETFYLQISNASVAIADATGVGTIVNDDTLLLPDLRISNVSQIEGNSGSSMFDFKVSLSTPAPQGGVSFQVRTVSGTAMAGVDYETLNTTGFIPEGSTSSIVSVKVFGDVTVENNETFQVLISNAPHAVIITAMAEGTIVNDDAPPGMSNITHSFRTRKNGNFNASDTWESSPDSFNAIIISPATLSPDNRSNTITVNHNVNVTANVAIDQTTVATSGSITVNANRKLDITDGTGADLIVNGNVVVSNGANMFIKSTASGTAAIGASTGTISGDVTVERFIPDDGRSAWRLLSAPVTGSRTIRQTWQENGRGIADSGTLILSDLYNGANGFDMTYSNSSILTHNQGGISGPSWSSLPGTLVPQSSYPGYMLYVHGDRTATPSNNKHNATTLRSTGNLKTGNQPMVTVSSTGSGYTLVGNPYAAPVTFESIASTPNLNQAFYYWDPKLGGVSGSGGYRLVERIGPGTYRQTPETAEAAVPDNTMQYIHSGQAFFLKATGADALVTFTENCKTDQLPSANPFKEHDLQPQLSTSLFVVNGNLSSLADGIRVQFDNAYSASVDKDDIFKIDNFSENLGIRRNGSVLIVEKRPMLSAGDTIYLNVANTSVKNYRLQVSTKNMQPGTTGYLFDNYLRTHTPLDLGHITTINFGVTVDPLSSANDRFGLVLETGSALPVTLSSMMAYQQGTSVAVEWKVQNETGIKQYEVEKSSDGRIFNTVAIKGATGNNLSSVAYHWMDTKPVAGNNFYRIRSTGLTGKLQYSQAVNVVIGRGKPDYRVYPNPVINGTFTLQLINQPQGLYTITLIDPLGQVLLTRHLVHSEGSSAENIDLGKIMVHGNYILEVTNAGRNRKLIKVVY